jgi:hypothetical protein
MNNATQCSSLGLFYTIVKQCLWDANSPIQFLLPEPLDRINGMTISMRTRIKQEEGLFLALSSNVGEGEK